MAGTSLGTAYVQIVPKATGIKGAISSQLGGEASAAGQSVGNNIASFAKKAIVAAGVGTAIVGSIGAALSEGGKLQQSYLGGVDTLYGEAADKVREYAQAASQAGISMNDYSEQAVSFGASLKAAFGGDVSKSAQAANTAIMDMADNSAKMGTDIESVQMAYQGFAKGQYMLLDNLKLGYGGTKTEMERLLADASELSGQDYSIDNLGDVYEAIHVIQGDLGLTGVAAEEASETFSGSFGAMKAAAQNLMGSLMLGEDVGPAMQTLATSASTFFFDNLVPALGNIMSNMPTLISTLMQEGLPKLQAGLSNLLSSLSSYLSENRESILAAIDSMASSAAKYLEANLPTFLATGAKIAAKIGIGLIKSLPSILGSIRKIVSAVGRGLLKGLGSVVSSALNSVKRKMSSIWSKIKEVLTKPVDAAKDKIKGIFDKIKDSFNRFKSAVTKPFNFLGNLKIPSIKISGGKAPFGIGGKGTKPSIGVTWHKKAMENPYMFGKATLFGAGEAGDEILYGRKKLLEDIRDATGGGGTFNVTLNATTDESPEQYAQRFTRELRRQVRMGAI